MRRAYCWLVFLSVMMTGGMTAVMVRRSPGVLDRPDGFALFGEATAAVLFAALAAGWLVGRLSTRVSQAALVGGVLGGTLLVLHLVSEQVGTRVGENGLVTLAVMVATFSCWVAAGAACRPSLRDAAAAGFGAAALGVLLTVAGGYILAALGLPAADYVSRWPEFRRSGWTDPAAFAVANTFDAAVGHVFTAIVLGPVLGAAGFACVGVIGRWWGVGRADV